MGNCRYHSGHSVDTKNIKYIIYLLSKTRVKYWVPPRIALGTLSYCTEGFLPCQKFKIDGSSINLLLMWLILILIRQKPNLCQSLHTRCSQYDIPMKMSLIINIVSSLSFYVKQWSIYHVRWTTKLLIPYISY